MNDERHLALKDQLLLGGAIGASLSHELNNVFAIIGELNGLLEDLVSFRDDSRGISPEKIENIAGRIAAEVTRGRKFGRRLNSFSHSVEGPNQEWNASEIMENVVDLCARFARLGKVRIDNRPSETPLPIEGTLYDVQHIFFRCLELALSVSKEDTAIAIAFSEAKDGFYLDITNEQPNVSREDHHSTREMAEMLTDLLEGTIETDLEQDRPLIIRLFLPRKRTRHERPEARENG